ncbi:MAG: hypothetical protein DRP54_08975, partial [Spirochaetes bacterium]
KIIGGDEFYEKVFGIYPQIISCKKEMMWMVWDIFKRRFSKNANLNKLIITYVPNRVELLGKHTDYQGGETFLLTGPRNFFAISAVSGDGLTELVNAEPEYGETIFIIRENGEVDVKREGEGSTYAITVAKRLSSNLRQVGLDPPKNIKSVFIGDIPFGGGTSGSSAKVIMDFLALAGANGLLEDRDFKNLIIENGRKAGIKLGQEGIDDFTLCLSMYLAHYENGLNFGDLKGDRGVGTFGGSEDHTAIFLGNQDKLLYCRYCPTEVLEQVDGWEEYIVVVGYSGKKAEKTKDALEKYNRLSIDAARAVKALNEVNKTNYLMLRDFYMDIPLEKRAEKAYEQLKSRDERLARRAYQFFKECYLTYRAVESVKCKDAEEYGKIINLSHDLSRDYLENIVPEIDFLKGSAFGLGAMGATGFGAGFGGSCYALIEKSRAEKFIDEWQDVYLKKYPEYSDIAQFDIYPPCRGCFWFQTYC